MTFKKDFLDLHYDFWNSNFSNITFQKKKNRFKFNPLIFSNFPLQLSELFESLKIVNFLTSRYHRISFLFLTINIVKIPRFIYTIILTTGIANRYKNYISYTYDNIYLRESIRVLFSYRCNERKKTGISAIIANIRKFTSMDILYVSDKIGKRNKDRRKHDEIRGNKLGCVFSMPQCRHPVVKLTVYFVVPAR